MIMFRDEDDCIKYIKSLKEVPKSNGIVMFPVTDSDGDIVYLVYDLVTHTGLAYFLIEIEAIRYAHFYENQEQYPKSTICNYYVGD